MQMLENCQQFLCLFFLLLICCGSDKLKQLKPELITHNVGKEKDPVKLKCGKRIPMPNSVRSIDVVFWQYKKCGLGLNMEPCDKVVERPWELARCKNGSNYCGRPTLTLLNPQESDSGLYKCLLKNYMSKDDEVVKVYELQIIDPNGETIEVLNEDESAPDNVTVKENESVLFRCRSKSLFPPEFLWLKKVDKVDAYSTYITDLKDYYQRLNGSGVYEGPNNMYITKLKISHSTVQDSGLYICFILNIRDYKLKEHYLNVLPSTVSDESTNPWKILTYVLPPLIAVVIIYFCYCLLKMSRRNKETAKHVYLKGQVIKQYLL